MQLRKWKNMSMIGIILAMVMGFKTESSRMNHTRRIEAISRGSNSARLLWCVGEAATQDACGESRDARPSKHQLS